MCMTLDKHGLTLNASGSDEEVVVNLKSLAFRQMDEGDALSIPWGQIEGMDYFFIGTVKNSNYLEWFVKQGSEIRTKKELTHYFLAFNDDVVDVIAYEPPTVSRRPTLNLLQDQTTTASLPTTR
ncbi:hypothetical protein PSA5_05765 [Pseudomonas syringae pv. actinidiae]|nr:hypothetical protein PSA5_05765 [Pseudomonas syringae pv. actinidiae]